MQKKKKKKKKSKKKINKAAWHLFKQIRKEKKKEAGILQRDMAKIEQDIREVVSVLYLNKVKLFIKQIYKQIFHIRK